MQLQVFLLIQDYLLSTSSISRIKNDTS